MTESEWLKSKDGEAMFPLTADQITPRKWALLACGLARRVLHLLPAQPFQDAIDFVERMPFTELNLAVILWQQRVDEVEAATRELARNRQSEVMKGFDLDAGHSSSDRDDDEGQPADRVFAAANEYATESVATAGLAAESAASAVRHLFASVGPARLEVVRASVQEALTRAAEVSVLAMIASDMAGKAERLADRPASRRKNLQFSIADNMVSECEDDAERRLERVHQDRRNSDNSALAHLLREQLGNPFRPYRFEPEWRTETVLALASAIEAEHAFDRMPILADALEEAGCDEQPMLDHLRGAGPHARGCWVLDLILNREPELFSQPPLVSTPRRMKLGPFTPPAEGMM